MFDTLSDKLQHALGDLRSKGRIDEEAISKAMREIRLALLEADVNFQVVKDFVALVRERATGQNGLQQARLFGEAAKVTGVALTKLDGTAKGGIAVAIAYELGLPVKLIGVGEGLDDLRPFDPADFARALVAG